MIQSIQIEQANMLKMFDFLHTGVGEQELCKGVHCVDLDESFQTHIYLQNWASTQPLERAF